MLYLEYERYRRSYYDAQRQYDAILQEKTRLFAQTQPRAARMDAERVMSSTIVNTFDAYLIAKEERRIDERLCEARSLLDGRECLLKQKEQELRQSKDVFDRIYRLRYIEHAKISRITREVCYSRAQVFRILDEMRQMLREYARDSTA